LELTQPIVSNAHGAQSMPVDRGPSLARPQDAHGVGTKETDAGEDWLHTATADPAFWLKECRR
jgi:hypothetical protein